MQIAFKSHHPMALLFIAIILALCCAICDGGKPRKKSTKSTADSAKSTAGKVVHDLRTVQLPFYDQIKVIVPMTELPAYNSPTKPGFAHAFQSFVLSREDLDLLIPAEHSQNLNENSKNLSYQLHLRMFLLNTAAEQPDDFPPGIVVYVDTAEVRLPALMQPNKSTEERKRSPRPVDITSYVNPNQAATKNDKHQLKFSWHGDERAWAFTVTLVRRLNAKILLERILNNPNTRRPWESTKQQIVQQFNVDEEDDVVQLFTGDEQEEEEDDLKMQMNSMKILLKDPLMLRLVKIPSRFSECKHLQCFDLENYLMMSESELRPKWKCPLCQQKATYSTLIIDTYFQEVVDAASPGDEFVELVQDGTWRLPRASAVDTIVDTESDSDETVRTVPTVPADDGTIAAETNVEHNDDDDDDDDDDDCVMFVPMPTPKKRRSSVSRRSSFGPSSDGTGKTSIFHDEKQVQQQNQSPKRKN